MNQDIIKIAEECGMTYIELHGGLRFTKVWLSDLERFYRLAQAEMQEKCAKVCDELVNDENTGAYANAAKWCAIRIRALGDSHD